MHFISTTLFLVELPLCCCNPRRLRSKYLYPAAVSLHHDDLQHIHHIAYLTLFNLFCYSSTCSDSFSAYHSRISLEWKVRPARRHYADTLRIPSQTSFQQRRPIGTRSPPCQPSIHTSQCESLVFFQIVRIVRRFSHGAALWVRFLLLLLLALFNSHSTTCTWPDHNKY